MHQLKHAKCYVVGKIDPSLFVSASKHGICLCVLGHVQYFRLYFVRDCARVNSGISKYLHNHKQTYC